MSLIMKWELYSCWIQCTRFKVGRSHLLSIKFVYVLPIFMNWWWCVFWFSKSTYLLRALQISRKLIVLDAHVLTPKFCTLKSYLKLLGVMPPWTITISFLMVSFSAFELFFFSSTSIMALYFKFLILHSALHK